MAEDEMQPVSALLSTTQLDGIARFQQERGVASRDVAIGLLLDIALEAASGRGRRYWDKSIADPPIGQVHLLADRLRDEGHGHAAERLHEATAGQRMGHALWEAVREVCQTVLTTIEALDPKTQLMAEELRLEIDKRLKD